MRVTPAAVPALLACALLALQACGGDGASEAIASASGSPASAPRNPASAPADPRETRGRELFAGPGACSACHGAAGGGTMLGPALAGRAGRWDEERLTEYLADPAGYAARHPEVEHRRMPQPAVTEPADLAALAAWTLRLMGA